MIKFALVFAVLGAASYADEQSALIDAIVQAGTNDYQDERHTLEIDVCQMTTFRWRQIPEEGWILWTSFQFEMQTADIVVGDKSKEKFAYAKLDEGPPEIGFGAVGFKMKPGMLARQERSILREPSLETTPSPRGDGTSHYYEFRDDFIFTFQGPGVFEKLSSFPRLYDQYVREYCNPTS